jgi:hypothetical protein
MLWLHPRTEAETIQTLEYLVRRQASLDSEMRVGLCLPFPSGDMQAQAYFGLNDAEAAFESWGRITEHLGAANAAAAGRDDETPRDGTTADFSDGRRETQGGVARIDVSWVDPKIARHQKTCWAALQLVAAGRGPLRAPTCNHTLRVASGGTASGQALMRRALLLLGPGELQELHESRSQGHTEGTCDFVASMLEQETFPFPGLRRKLDAPARDSPISRALGSLRVIRGENVTLPVALILQCATVLTDLEGYDLGYDPTNSVLPRCTRLESLTLRNWYECPPTAWLVLSQLHTLRGVSLSDVPAATIAAALPRLHTLHLNNVHGDFPVDEFFDQLLPRLRSFGLEGKWPKMRDDTEMADAPPLPLLEDLIWHGRDVNLPRQFMGARPSTLDTYDGHLIEWLQATHSASADAPALMSPLARVRILIVRFGHKLQEATFGALLLRAAPHLRQLTVHTYVWAHVRWVLSDNFPSQLNLVHPRLRHVAFTNECPPRVRQDVPVPNGCGVRLRQRHFPRLRRLTVDEEEYPV